MVAVNASSANSTWEQKVKLCITFFFWLIHYDLNFRSLQSFASNPLKGKNKEFEGMPTTAEAVLWC